jgi:glycosyltransferase 2 family protein
VPVTPGNIGIVPAINVLLLGTFGVRQAPALAYGVAHQGIFYVVILGLGLICFYREGMSLNLLGRAGRESRVEEVSPASQS